MRRDEKKEEKLVEMENEWNEMRLKFDWNGMERTLPYLKQEPYLTLPDLTLPYLTTFTLPCFTLPCLALLCLSIHLPILST